jgi:hypothetical protein
MRENYMKAEEAHELAVSSREPELLVEIKKAAEMGKFHLIYDARGDEVAVAEHLKALGYEVKTSTSTSNKRGTKTYLKISW